MQRLLLEQAWIPMPTPTSNNVLPSPPVHGVNISAGSGNSIEAATQPTVVARGQLPEESPDFDYNNYYADYYKLAFAERQPILLHKRESPASVRSGIEYRKEYLVKEVIGSSNGPLGGDEVFGYMHEERCKFHPSLYLSPTIPACRFSRAYRQ